MTLLDIGEGDQEQVAHRKIIFFGRIPLDALRQRLVHACIAPLHDIIVLHAIDVDAVIPAFPSEPADIGDMDRRETGCQFDINLRPLSSVITSKFSGNIGRRCHGNDFGRRLWYCGGLHGEQKRGGSGQGELCIPGFLPWPTPLRQPAVRPSCNCLPRYAERWPSGRRRTPGKCV